MVTDTALMRNPHYHARGDVPDTIAFDALARVTLALDRVVRIVACTSPL
jgi:hypothetical protein